MYVGKLIAEKGITVVGWIIVHYNNFGFQVFTGFYNAVQRLLCKIFNIIIDYDNRELQKILFKCTKYDFLWHYSKFNIVRRLTHIITDVFLTLQKTTLCKLKN